MTEATAPKEINAETVNASLERIESFMQVEVDTYGENATVPLSMSIMTYLCASMLVGYMRVTKCTPQEVVVDHLTALKQCMKQLNAIPPQEDMH